MIKLPTIIINFKTYNEASGYDAEELAKICKQISDEKKASIVCAPQSADIYRCAETGIEIFAQHGDVEEAGGHTGKISLKALKENGAIGVLINHSEDRIPFTNIENLIKLMHQTDLISTVCVRDVHEAIGIAKLHPDMIAIEPPELIGGDISVTTADPKIISQTVEAVHEVDSEIMKITEESYKRIFNVNPEVKAIHAGLECGLFLEKYPYLDMISFGPTIKGAHSPDERMNIPTVQKFWDLLVDVLKNI